MIFLKLNIHIALLNFSNNWDVCKSIEKRAHFNRYILEINCVEQYHSRKVYTCTYSTAEEKQQETLQYCTMVQEKLWRFVNWKFSRPILQVFLVLLKLKICDRHLVQDCCEWSYFLHTNEPKIYNLFMLFF